NMVQQCLIQCPVSCFKSIYLYELNEVYKTLSTVKFKLRGSAYIAIIYSKKYTFIGLIISMANILSLWHGISFIGLLRDIIAFIQRFLYNSRINTLFLKMTRRITLT